LRKPLISLEELSYQILSKASYLMTTKKFKANLALKNERRERNLQREGA
jgi:hypothetical protein